MSFISLDCVGPNRICANQVHPHTNAITLQKNTITNFAQQDSPTTDGVAIVDVSAVDAYLNDIQPEIVLVYDNKCMGYTCLPENEIPEDKFSWNLGENYPTTVTWLNDDLWEEYIPKLESLEYQYNDFTLVSVDSYYANELVYWGNKFGYINADAITQAGYDKPVSLHIINSYNKNGEFKIEISYKCYTATCVAFIPAGAGADFEINFLEQPATESHTQALFKISAGTNTFVYKRFLRCLNTCSWQGVDKKGELYELKYDDVSKTWIYKNVTQDITLATSELTEIKDPTTLDAGNGLNIKGVSNEYMLKPRPCIYMPAPVEDNNDPSVPAGQGFQPFIPDVRSPIHGAT